MIALLEELEKKSQELPVNEREILANYILHSVHDQELTPLENEWLEIAEKRFNALWMDQIMVLVKPNSFSVSASANEGNLCN